MNLDILRESLIECCEPMAIKHQQGPPLKSKPLSTLYMPSYTPIKVVPPSIMCLKKNQEEEEDPIPFVICINHMFEHDLFNSGHNSNKSEYSPWANTKRVTDFE